MKPPPRFQLSLPSFVSKLNSLYGLIQASRQWNSKFSIALRSKGYSLSQNDHSLFLKKTNDSLIIVVVYVDDILVIGDDLQEINSLNNFLHDQFQTKDIGFLNFFLCLEFC